MAYTEKDIQDYLDGAFAGDAADLQNYLKQDADAQKQMELYSLLYAGIKEQPLPTLSINLADAVMNKLEKRAAAKDLRWARAALLTMLMLAVITFVVSYTYFGMHHLLNATSVGWLFVSTPVFVAFIFGFHFIELQVKKKKFTVSFNEPGY